VEVEAEGTWRETFAKSYGGKLFQKLKSNPRLGGKLFQKIKIEPSSWRETFFNNNHQIIII
jgi:hypothetical protein